MDVTRIFDILEYKSLNHPNHPVFTAKEDGKWVKHYLKEYIEKANNISYGLLKLGLQRGEKVALISSSRPEWNYLDMGVQQIGAVMVPIYPTISEDDYRYILDHAEAQYIFIEGPELLRKIRNILPDLKSVKDVYTFKKRDENISSFDELLALGQANAVPEKLKEIKDSIQPSDIVTMIYTSGTTGVPKGVMLSHDNLISNFMAVRNIPNTEFTRCLSYLPLCHIYERMMNYMYQYRGFEIFYAENVGKVADNIKETQPEMMTTVPRLLEKIYDKVYRKGEKLKGIKKEIFYWALEYATDYEFENTGFVYNLKRKIADKLVYSAIRENFGVLQLVVSGGAAIQPRLARFFNCLGMDIFEGYGLTETSPVIAVSRREKGGRKVGTVGPPLDGIEVKIDSGNNEILCRGRNVMLGYYKAPDLTAEVIDSEGWFHTGDTGALEKGLLRITGRVKSLFKTSMGKYVNPEAIEAKFKESPFILDMMVVGENQKFAAAIITPDFEFLKDWQLRHGIKCNSQEEMIVDKETLARYNKVMAKYNKYFGDTEQIKRFKLVNEVWSESNGFLTPTMKLRRKKVMEVYSEEIENLFK